MSFAPMPLDPGAAQAFGILQSGTAFSSPVTGALTALQSQMTAALAGLQALPEAIGDQLGGAVTQIQGILAADGPLESFATHVGDQIAKLPSNLTVYANHANLQSGLGALADLCSGIESFFGSIVGAGMALVDKALGIVGTIQTTLANIASMAMSAVTDAINGALGALGTVMDRLTAMVAQEVRALADALADLLNLANILNLRALMNHPCARMVLNTVGTGSMVAALTA